MLIKLLKYDIKSTAKLFVLMSAVMLGLSLTAFLGGRLQNMIVLGLIVTVAALVSIAYICAYFVICGLHFYKQMTGRESYLMHTLPVKPHTLVLSKYLSTLFWGIFTTAVLCAFWFGAAEFLLFKPFSYSLYVMFHDEAVSGSIIIYLFAVIAAQYFLYPKWATPTTQTKQKAKN